MSMSVATGYEGGQREDYHISPAIVPTSGFLTPPSPYNVEGARRDSIASSWSSMSYASGVSDFSGPVTPTYAHSPMTDEGFVDIMAYDLGHDSQSQTFHGFPMSQQPKVPGSEQSLCGSWQLVPHTPEQNEAQLTPFRPQLVLPPSGNYLQPSLVEHTGLDAAVAPTIDSSWSNLSTTVHTGIGRQWNNHIVPEGNLQVFWASQIHQPQVIQMQAIIPSDTMAEVDSDYTFIEADQFTESDSFDRSASSFPQSPQEVSFERENSPMVKHESDAEDASPRLRRSIYVSPTGGKSVKKERQSGASKKRSKVMKHRDRQPSFNINGIDAKLDGVECMKDEETGKYRWFGTRHPNEKKRCPHIDDQTGIRCTKFFVRPEHLKRHEQTHSGERQFHCTICMRKFNRNDNCQEHYWTHVRRPGKKDGRNPKMSLAEVESFCMDPINGPKLVEKLRQKWKNEVEIQEIVA